MAPEEGGRGGGRNLKCSPELGANLVTALASLDVDDLTAGFKRKVSQAAPCRNRQSSAGGRKILTASCCVVL